MASRSVTMAQLEPGTFEARYSVIDARLLTVSRRSMNLRVRGEVVLPPHSPLLYMAADRRTDARVHGTPMDYGSIVTTNSFLDMVTGGPSTFYSVTIDERLLAREYSTVPDALSLIENVQSINLIHDPIRARRLRSFFEQLFRSHDEPQAAMVSRDWPAERIFGAFIPLLASSVDHIDRHVVEPSRCFTRRLSAVRACEAYIREYCDSSITLLDLGRVSGMRSRSLINAFAAVTGLSPMEYLRRLRLTGVHNVLLRADRPRTRIIDVAADWGFWHLGHFIEAYRAMFGETPSQTLAQSL
jgi:AraC family transcriptional regulator, ethanolamine operon transcriptional activator